MLFPLTKDISDWNIASATDMDLMFDGSNALSDAKKVDS